jgi:integrase
LSQLLAAAEAGPIFHGMTGRVRGLLYQTALYSGYRWSELRSLEKTNFDFAACSVSIGAEHAKNEKNATNPLPHDLAATLAEHAKLFMPSAKMFAGMWKGKGAEMIRRDMKAAGIPERDETGQSRDFHSLRHSLATLLARHGVALAIAQKIMRHSDPKPTMNVYGHLRIEDKAKELAKLPFVFPTAGPENEAAKATGTDGNHWQSHWR